MVDHSWLISAMRDIRDYAMMNRLGHLVPVVKAACAAVERELDGHGKEDRMPRISPSAADAALAAALAAAHYVQRGIILGVIGQLRQRLWVANAVTLGVVQPQCPHAIQGRLVFYKLSHSTQA